MAVGILVDNATVTIGKHRAYTSRRAAGSRRHLEGRSRSARPRSSRRCASASVPPMVLPGRSPATSSCPSRSGGLRMIASTIVSVPCCDAGDVSPKGKASTSRASAQSPGGGSQQAFESVFEKISAPLSESVDGLIDSRASSWCVWRLAFRPSLSAVARPGLFPTR